MKLQKATKRVIDILLASIGLILAAPLMGIIGLAVKLDGQGKVIFQQPRLGYRGEPFILYKFRKFPDAHGEKGPGVTVANDIRMTRLGEVLERFKLDELPQLWNIFRGDMSFVGPRPESIRYKELFVDEFAEVFDYLPGIFGPSQVAFRNESSMYPPNRDPEEYYRTVLFPQKARMDLEYFRRSSVWRDFVWIVRGIWVTVFNAINWRRTVGLHGRIVVLDLIAVLVAWTSATVIRFGSLPEPDRHWDVYLSGLWLMPLVVIPLMMVGGCYRHPVRYFALVDAIRMLTVASIAWGLAFLILLGFLHRHSSVMLAPLGLLLLFPMMVAPRLWWRERWRRRSNEDGRVEQRRLVIYGAGLRGSSLVSLLQQGFPMARIVGFLDDDDQAMRGRVIEGHKVLGSERDLGTIHSVYGIDQIWMTFLPDEHKYRRLYDWCQENKVDLIVLPTTPPFSHLAYGDTGEVPADALSPTVPSIKKQSSSGIKSH